MKHKNKVFILWLLLMTSFNSFATEYFVSSSSEFNSLNGSLQPGDVVIWENGVYSEEGSLRFIGNGTEENPIVFKPETIGQVVFTGKMELDIGGTHLVVDGFHWQGGEGASNFIEFRGNGIYSQYCTIQNCVIDGLIIDPDQAEENANPTDPDDSPSIAKHRWVVLYGNYNNVLNCTFMNKASAGALVLVELEYNAFSNGEDDPTSVNTRSVEVGHTISNNYFFNYEKIDANLSNSGDSETIRVGTSEYQNVNCATTVSNNYFVEADGENEIITNKSRNNNYVNNTFRRCRGSLVLRHGAGATVEGNVFLGEDVDGTGGIRIVDSDHIITNNYIQDCITVLDQAKWNNGVTFMGGSVTSVTDPNIESLSNGYQKTENITFSKNTIVNTNAPLFFNGDKGKNDATGVVSDNIIYYDNGNANMTDVITGDDSDSFSSISEFTYNGNVYNTTNLGETVGGFTVASLTATPNGEIFDISGVIGKGADLNGYEPITNAMVGNGIGACFLDFQGMSIANPDCTVEGVEPIDSFSVVNITGFSAEAGQETTSIFSNISWTAVVNDDWITIGATSGAGNSLLNVGVMENTTFETRTGTVTFNQVDGALERVLTITQEGLELTDLYTLINTGGTNDPVEIIDFSKEQVGFDDGAERFNYATNTLDKNISTRWAANDLEGILEGEVRGDGEYIIYDLGSVYDLGLIQLSTDSGKDHAYGYQIWSSDENPGGDVDPSTINFTKLFPDATDFMLTEAGSSEFQQTEVSVNARFVKLIGFGRFNADATVRESFWTNITEIEFFGRGNVSLSADENVLNEISIYPIPANGTLNLKNIKNDIEKVTILNLEGKKIVTKEISDAGKLISIDTSSLLGGLYILRVTYVNGNSLLKKIIVQ